MDKNAIKKFAVWARRELIARVSQKAAQYGIEENSIVDGSADHIGELLLTADQKKQRQALIAQLKEKGYQQVMEEVAYTWFNRFVALRFMEVNNYLPSHVRVFTDEEDNFKPQMITEAIHLELDGLDMEKVYALKEADRTEELYRYLLITQCNALNQILPKMFQKIADYTELLLPDNLLRKASEDGSAKGSILYQMVTDIPTSDWRDAVQIIGWLYQYYNTEIKEAIDRVQGTKKIKKSQIPAATQIFTPDWIVRYMVENTLGRFWLERHPNGSLQASWTHYVDSYEQKSIFAPGKEKTAILPEEITCIDPCAGSGHIIAYMFDVLVQIYESYGYTVREAVCNIIEKNIYGLDIDDRAAQLAYFTVMMKARQYDSRFFARKNDEGNPDVLQPHIYSICESNVVDAYALEYFVNGDINLEAAIATIIQALRDAKEYGALILPTKVNFNALYKRIEAIKNDIDIRREIVLEYIFPLIKVSEILSKRYDVVSTNPPYMGSRLLNEHLRQFMADNYAEAKTDTYAAFVLRCLEFKNTMGFVGMMTPNTWLTINSYKKLREYIVSHNLISSMLLLSSEAFNDAGVVINSFVLNCDNRKTTFCNLQGFDEDALSSNFGKCITGKITRRDSGLFLKLPNTVIDPSFSETMITVISENKSVRTVMQSDGQTKTGDNEKYLRMLWEVNRNDVGSEGQHWCLHAKGGGYRKWYGNVDAVIDWSLEARIFYRKDHVARITPEYLWYKEGITWSLISGQHNSFRLLPETYTFNCAAPTVFFTDKKREYFVLGLLNTNFAQELLRKFNATINLTIDDIGSIPYCCTPDFECNVVSTVTHCIELSKADWDSFETSWDFSKLSLIRPVSTVSDAFAQWEAECDDRFNQLKANEEELNRIFIDIYGLQEELTPEVEDKDVTVRKADLQRDIKSLISYAVGCMFGRYSPLKDGLLYAGGDWDYAAIQQELMDAIGKNEFSSSDMVWDANFIDKDNIIPICDDDYFKDDIVGRFINFISAVYGKDTLEENLKFIADALGGKGQPKEVIRNYFLNDFFADHCKIYQKRPIYWLFDSGKKNGFKALIYMHRYQPDTIARIRTDYVHEQQARYRTAIQEVQRQLTGATTADKVRLNKKLNKLTEQDAELRTYEEKVHHLADQMIPIDLDDGVKVNYAKFQDVLAKIK